MTDGSDRGSPRPPRPGEVGREPPTLGDEVAQIDPLRKRSVGGQDQLDGFPDEFKAEAAEMEAVLADLKASDGQLDWFYVSPAGGFGPWAPGEATGVYRVGGDVLLVDETGESAISGADLGTAIAAEIGQPVHRRARFTVAY